MADDPKAKATENAKKRAAEGKEARDAGDAQRAAIAKGTPTPTQEECDVACSGGYPELAEDGSGPEQTQTKQVEAGKPGGGYATRQSTAQHPASRAKAE